HMMVGRSLEGNRAPGPTNAGRASSPPEETDGMEGRPAAANECVVGWVERSAAHQAVSADPLTPILSRGEREKHAVRLRVRRFSSPGRFANVDLELRAGEIMGLAGLVGAGRSEILEALFGLDGTARGETLVDGKPVRIRSPREAQAVGMA